MAGGGGGQAEVCLQEAGCLGELLLPKSQVPDYGYLDGPVGLLVRQYTLTVATLTD